MSGHSQHDPVDPTLLAWNGGPNPSGSETVTASWANGGEADIDFQRVNFYTTGDCSLGVDTTSDISGSGTVTKAYTRSAVTARTTHSFSVQIHDLAGRTSNVICVNTTDAAMVIDNEAPPAPTLPNWSEAPKTNLLTVNSNWTVSTNPDTDVASQNIYYYPNNNCTLPITVPVRNVGIIVNSDTLAVGSGNFYSFKVGAVDTAGNESISDCVDVANSAVEIDTSAPQTAITSDGWVEASPSTILGVNSQWTDNTASEPDVAVKTITYYIDSGCTSPAGIVDDTLATTALTYAPTLLSDNSYFFTIKIADDVGNSTTSGCSSEMIIDSTAPTPSINLDWAEIAPHNDILVTAEWTKSGST